MFARVNASGWVVGDKLTPAQINALDINVSRAVDGIGGGTYSLLTKLSFEGSGGVEISGTGAAQWLLLGSRTIVRWHRLEIANVVLNVGAGADEPSAVLRADSSGFPVVRTVAAFTIAQASFHWVAVTPPCNGAKLNSVTLTTRGHSGGAGLQLPAYFIGVYSGSVGQASSVITDAHATDGSNWLSAVSTTITANPSTFAATDTSHFVVHVTNPFGPSAVQMDIVSLTSSWTLTSLQPV